LCAVEERGDVDVAVALKRVEEVGRTGGTGRLLRGMAWSGGSCGGVRW